MMADHPNTPDRVQRALAEARVDKLKVEQFLVLNGLEEGQPLQPGQLVKTLVQD